tara:strand:+ start:163 stop:492 length:330 start_codon:yes stop_codon:yes gene_type:complete
MACLNSPHTLRGCAAATSVVDPLPHNVMSEARARERNLSRPVVARYPPPPTPGRRHDIAFCGSSCAANANASEWPAAARTDFAFLLNLSHHGWWGPRNVWRKGWSGIRP